MTTVTNHSAWIFRIIVGIVGIVLVYHIGHQALGLLHHLTANPWLSHPQQAIQQLAQSPPSY